MKILNDEDIDKIVGMIAFEILDDPYLYQLIVLMLCDYNVGLTNYIIERMESLEDFNELLKSYLSGDSERIITFSSAMHIILDDGVDYDE